MGSLPHLRVIPPLFCCCWFLQGIGAEDMAAAFQASFVLIVPVPSGRLMNSPWTMLQYKCCSGDPVEVFMPPQPASVTGCWVHLAGALRQPGGSQSTRRMQVRQAVRGADVACAGVHHTLVKPLNTLAAVFLPLSVQHRYYHLILPQRPACYDVAQQLSGRIWRVAWECALPASTCRAHLCRL